MRKRKPNFFAIAYYLLGAAISTFLIVREQYLWTAAVLLSFYFAARFFGKLAANRRFDGIVIGLLHLGDGQAPKSFIVQYFVHSTPETDLGTLEKLVQSTIERLEKEGRVKVENDVVSRIT